jgi:hypothetical protein
MKDTDRLIMLMEEISILENKLQPEDTGHIHTAISVLKTRVQEVKAEIDNKPVIQKPVGRMDLPRVSWATSPEEQKIYDMRQRDK